MRRDSHRHFNAYCQNLQRIGLVELIDEHRRQAELRSWRASLVRAPLVIGDGKAAVVLAAL